MIQKIKNLFKTTDSKIIDSNLDSLSISGAQFELKYKTLIIGFLKFNSNTDTWSFSYSEAFKAQNEIAPIISFPDVNKEYKGKELWSFFSSRIPDNTNASSSYNEKISNVNLIDLLKAYGQKTITNPFDLSVS